MVKERIFHDSSFVAVCFILLGLLLRHGTALAARYCGCLIEGIPDSIRTLGIRQDSGFAESSRL